jgi:hypothetical protein
MAKGKSGGKPAPVVKSGPDRGNGKAWKKRPLIFDAVKRKLRVMTSSEYDVIKQNAMSTKRKSED